MGAWQSCDDSSLQNEITELKKRPVSCDNNALQSKITKLEKRPVSCDNTALQNEITELKKRPVSCDNTALQSKITELEKRPVSCDNTALQNEITELKKRPVSCDNTDLQSKITSLRRENENLQNSIRELTDDSEFRKLYNECNANFGELITNFDQIKSERDSLTALNEQNSRIITSMSNTQNSITQELSQIKAERDNLKVEKRNLQLQLDDCKGIPYCSVEKKEKHMRQLIKTRYNILIQQLDILKKFDDILKEDRNNIHQEVRNISLIYIYSKLYDDLMNKINEIETYKDEQLEKIIENDNFYELIFYNGRGEQELNNFFDGEWNNVTFDNLNKRLDGVIGNYIKYLETYVKEKQ